MESTSIYQQRVSSFCLQLNFSNSKEPSHHRALLVDKQCDDVVDFVNWIHVLLRGMITVE